MFLNPPTQNPPTHRKGVEKNTQGVGGCGGDDAPFNGFLECIQPEKRVDSEMRKKEWGRSGNGDIDGVYIFSGTGRGEICVFVCVLGSVRGPGGQTLGNRPPG